MMSFMKSVFTMFVKSGCGYEWAGFTYLSAVLLFELELDEGSAFCFCGSADSEFAPAPEALLSIGRPMDNILAC